MTKVNKSFAQVCERAIKSTPIVDNINLLLNKDNVLDYIGNIYYFTSGELGGIYEDESERFSNKVATPQDYILNSLDPRVLKTTVVDYDNKINKDKTYLLDRKNELKEDIKTLRYTPFTENTKTSILSKQKELKILRFLIEKKRHSLMSTNYQPSRMDVFSTTLACDSIMSPQGLTLTDYSYMPQKHNPSKNGLSVDETTSIISFCDLPYILTCGSNNISLKSLNSKHIGVNADMFLYTNDNNKRSLGDTIMGVRDYTNWNGLVVIDVDLKNDPSFKALSSEEQESKTNEYIEKLKRDLGSHRWLFAIKPSNSNKGIHIYTKVSKPQQNNNDYQQHNFKCYNQFMFNYFHKHAIISYLLEQYGVDVRANDREETFDYYKPYEKVVTVKKDKEFKSIVIKLDNDPSFRVKTSDLKDEFIVRYTSTLKRDLKSNKWFKNVNITNYNIKVNTNIPSNDTFDVMYICNLLTSYGVDIFAEKRKESYLVKDKKYGEVIDFHTSSIAQGIRVAPKPNTYINTSFVDVPFQVTLSDVIMYNNNVVSFDEYFMQNDLLIKGLKETLEKSDLLTNKTDLNKAKNKLNGNYTLSQNKQLSPYKTQKQNNDTFNLEYTTRYQMVDTVCYYIEDKEEATNILFDVLGVNDGLSNESEIKGFITSAYRGNKRVFKNSVRQLQKLGYNIGLKDDKTIEDVKNDAVSVIKETLNIVDSSDHSIYNNNNKYHIDKYIDLNKGEYLSNKRDEILSSLKDNKVNYIESLAGTGKTHLFKELSKEQTVCLVLPFTSIIMSKIESDSNFKDTFTCYYDGAKSSEVTGYDNVCMTFDKFSNLSVEVVDRFDFVVIDEAHLLFNSFYRMNVCSNVLDNIMELVNTYKEIDHGFYHNTEIYGVARKTKNLILMSGTPSEETNYFYDNNMLNYIKINSKIKHNKRASFILCPDNESKNTHLLNKLMFNINNGVKNIIITDMGEVYSKPIISSLEKMLNRPLKTSYFKRSLKDDKTNNDIMFNASYDKDLDILFGSSYLSVGVDIENEKEKFNVFFPNNEHTAEDIEQFNNRLRRTNIESYIYDVIMDSKGDIRDYESEYKILLDQYTIYNEDVIRDDEKINSHNDNTLDNSFLNIKTLAHKDYMFKDDKFSSSLKAINEYQIIHSAKKNIGYIYEQLSNKYQYEVNTIEYTGKNNSYMEILRDKRTQLTDRNKQLVKQAVISSFDITNILEIKPLSIVFTNDVEVEFREERLFVNSEYKDFYKVIFPIIQNLTTVYSRENIDYVTDLYNTKNSLNTLNSLIDIKKCSKPLSKTSEIVQDKILSLIGSNKTISFIPDNYNDDMPSVQAKILSTEKYDNVVTNILDDVINELSINKDNKIHIPRIRKGIEDTFSKLFDKKRTHGVISMSFKTIPEFDIISELEENDQYMDNTIPTYEEKKENIANLIGNSKPKMTKRDKTRLVKRLLKAYFKVNEQSTISNVVETIKNDYMEQTGDELNRKDFEKQYKDLYKRSGNKITGLK